MTVLLQYSSSFCSVTLVIMRRLLLNSWWKAMVTGMLFFLAKIRRSYLHTNI